MPFVPSPWHAGCLVVRGVWGCLLGVWDWLGPHQLTQRDPRMWVLPTDGRVQGDSVSFPSSALPEPLLPSHTTTENRNVGVWRDPGLKDMAGKSDGGHCQ